MQSEIPFTAASGYHRRARCAAMHTRQVASCLKSCVQGTRTILAHPPAACTVLQRARPHRIAGSPSYFAPSFVPNFYFFSQLGMCVAFRQRLTRQVLFRTALTVRQGKNFGGTKTKCAAVPQSFQHYFAPFKARSACRTINESSL